MRRNAVWSLMVLSAGACAAPDARELYGRRGPGGGAAQGGRDPGRLLPGDAGSSGDGGRPGAFGAGAAGGSGASASAGGSGRSEAQAGSVGFVPGAGGGVTAAGREGVALAPALDAGVAADGSAGPDVCRSANEACDGLDNDCDGEVDEDGACAVGCAGFALGQRGYMFCSVAVTREVALTRCGAQGLRLVWIETPEENAALQSSVAAADVPTLVDNEEILTQIGASDAEAEGEWLWQGAGSVPDGFQFWRGTSADVDGQALGGAYANWSSTEPNDTDQQEDCADISILGANTRVAGQWDDRSCDLELPFLCEVP
jgi:hypothetical protein